MCAKSLQNNELCATNEATAEVLETPRRPNLDPNSGDSRMADARYPVWGYPRNMHVCQVPFKGIVK